MVRRQCAVAGSGQAAAGQHTLADLALSRLGALSTLGSIATIGRLRPASSQDGQLAAGRQGHVPVTLWARKELRKTHPWRVYDLPLCNPLEPRIPFPADTLGSTRISF